MALSIGLAMDGSLGLAHGFAGYNAALLGILLLPFDRPPTSVCNPASGISARLPKLPSETAID
jgi:hypothetical protein